MPLEIKLPSQKKIQEKTGLNTVISICVQTGVYGLSANEIHAVVLRLKHRIRILAILCLHADLSLFYHESNFQNDLFQNFETGLDALVILHVGIVIKQGTQINPDTARFQHVINRFYEFHNIGGTVDKEASRNAVPLVRISVHFQKIARCHGEFAVRHRHRYHIWKSKKCKIRFVIRNYGTALFCYKKNAFDCYLQR